MIIVSGLTFCFFLDRVSLFHFPRHIRFPVSQQGCLIILTHHSFDLSRCTSLWYLPHLRAIQILQFFEAGKFHQVESWLLKSISPAVRGNLGAMGAFPFRIYVQWSAFDCLTHTKKTALQEKMATKKNTSSHLSLVIFYSCAAFPEGYRGHPVPMGPIWVLSQEKSEGTRVCVQCCWAKKPSALKHGWPMLAMKCT